MKLYRIDKLAKRNGAVVKKKHILAKSDQHAVQQAEDSAGSATARRHCLEPRSEDHEQVSEADQKYEGCDCD